MQPHKPSLIQQFRALPRLAQIVLALVGVFLAIFVGSAAISGISAGFYGPGGPPTPTAASVQSNGNTPTDAPTDTPVPAVVQYPPQTLADLQGLAAQGDGSAIHEFHSENTGLATCLQPRRDVIVDPKITGQQLAQDLLAYFYSQHLDNPCGASLFAFHTQSEANAGNGYTAGRVLLQVADSSGAANVDPNATGLTYTLTLDVGDIGTGKEYTVTWQQ